MRPLIPNSNSACTLLTPSFLLFFFNSLVVICSTLLFTSFSYDMTSSTLKERIAALQQRSTSPQSSPPRKTASGVPIPKNALRDKIARFEEKGSISKSKAAIGLAKTGEQLNVRAVSLSTSDQARHVQRLGYSRSISEAHEVSRDSASSPTSSHGDTFSETYEEEFHSHPSSVLHSPLSSHSHEIHAASISTPLITVDNNAESLSEDLGALRLEVQNIHSSESNAESDKILPLFTNNGQEYHNTATNQVVEAAKSSRPFQVALQTPEKGGNIPSESLTAEQSLSDSTISVPTSVDDSANQVLPILDAFPTVPGHIPLSHSSRSISVPSQQAVINLSAFDSTFDSKSINNISNIHSIPSSAPAPTASSYSPTVTISSNSLEPPPPARPRPSQGHKTIPRPKSSVPFWYDDDSDDGEPGWVSVTVTTRRY